MAQRTDARRWRAASGLIWTTFDDSNDWVVYDPASDDVHLLTASAYLLWTLVSDEQAHTVESLADSLAAASGLPPDENMRATIVKTLISMDDAGLVRPMTP